MAPGQYIANTNSPHSISADTDVAEGQEHDLLAIAETIEEESDFLNHMKQYFAAHDTIKMSAVHLYYDIQKAHKASDKGIWEKFPVPNSTDKETPALFDLNWGDDEDDNESDDDAKKHKLSWYNGFFYRTKQGAAQFSEIESCRQQKKERRKQGTSTADLADLDSDLKLAIVVY